MNDPFDVADKATARLSARLIKAGVPPEIASDAMMTSALGLWAAATGRHQTAAFLLGGWQALREATDHG
jgi:hypothetical protein